MNGNQFVKITRKQFFWSDGVAVGGLIVWLLFISFAPRGAEGVLRTIENLLALAALVHLPLAIGLLYRPGDPVWGGDLLHAAQRFQPWAAASMLISLMLSPGLIAFLFALPWLAISLSMALAALSWLYHNRWQINHQLLFCAGMIYLPVGAGWLLLYRLGIRPLGFDTVIVLLTAVHFHYTGFILPIFTGMAGRWIKSCEVRNRLYPWLAIGIILAMPIIATGITLSPLIEVLGVALLFLSILGLVGLLAMVIAPLLTVNLLRILFAVSALSILLSISLGMFYGLGEFSGQQWLSIPQMVALHGWLNGVGFAGCGLLAWRIIFPPSVGDGKALLAQEW